MSGNPLTFSSRKLHLIYDLLLHSCMAAVQSIVHLATANLLCLNSISLSPAVFFPLNGHPIDHQSPPSPFRRPRSSQETQGPKSKSEAAFLSSPLEALASWQIIPCSARAPPTKVQRRPNASGKKLDKSTQMHTSPGQPP